MSFPWEACKAGDQVSGRMAFKAAYSANRAKYGASVIVLDGSDQASKEAVVLEAVKNGRIPTTQARAILPSVAGEQWTLIEKARKALVAA